MEIALSVIGAVVGIAGLIYAIMTNHAKAYLERLIRAELRGFAGNIDHIRNSAHGANEHLHYIRKFAANLEVHPKSCTDLTCVYCDTLDQLKHHLKGGAFIGTRHYWK